MPPSKCLAYIVILCFPSRNHKQNSVIFLNSNILAPVTFWAGYATARQFDKAPAKAPAEPIISRLCRKAGSTKEKSVINGMISKKYSKNWKMFCALFNFPQFPHEKFFLCTNLPEHCAYGRWASHQCVLHGLWFEWRSRNMQLRSLRSVTSRHKAWICTCIFIQTPSNWSQHWVHSLRPCPQLHIWAPSNFPASRADGVGHKRCAVTIARLAFNLFLPISTHALLSLWSAVLLKQTGKSFQDK